MVTTRRWLHYVLSGLHQVCQTGSDAQLGRTQFAIVAQIASGIQPVGAARKHDSRK
jgi:hypothetical protein